MTPSFEAALNSTALPALVFKNDSSGTIVATNQDMQALFPALCRDLPSLNVAIDEGILDPDQRPEDQETWGDHCDPIYSCRGVIRGHDSLWHTVQLFATRLDGEHCLLTISIQSTHPSQPYGEWTEEKWATIAYHVTENIPVGTYTMILEPGQELAQFSFMSTRFLELTGLTREQALSDPLAAFACVHPDDYDAWVALNAEAFANKTTFYGETRVVIDGQTRWIVAESNVRQRADGSYVWEGAISDITHQKKAEEALARVHADLLEQTARSVRMEERKALLEDLHDGFASQLAIAQHQLNHEELTQEELRDIIKKCQDDLHLMAHSMGTAQANLQEAVADWRYRVSAAHRVSTPKLVWDVDLRSCPRLEPQVVLHILRILQEGLANAVKHAEARTITVMASITPGHSIDFRIIDDGQGFDVFPKPFKHRGLGLANMQRRADSIQADLTIEAGQTGTQITLHVPLPSELA